MSGYSKQPIIAFHSDVSAAVGLGHLRRCLTLASELRRHGATCVFEIEQGREIVESAGFSTGRELAAAAVVVDSYRIGIDELADIRRQGTVTVAIDDLADRVLAVDLVINPGAGAEELSYEHARLSLLGVRFALLRPEFAEEPERVFSETARHIFLSLGGGDNTGLVSKLLPAILRLGFERVDVVVGPLSPGADELRELARQSSNVEIHFNPPDMRNLMLRADMALTGGGQTLYELAATSTPAVAIEIASNQTRNIMGLCGMGVILTAGKADDSRVAENSAAVVGRLAADWQARRILGENGRRLVDGRGAARAAASILDLLRTTEQ